MTALTRFRIAIVAPFPHSHDQLEGWMTRISSIDYQFRGMPRIYVNFSESHDDSRCKEIARDKERAEVVLNPSGKKSAAFMSDLAAAVDAIYVHTLHLAEHVLPWLNTGKVYVDIHGVTPEEEESLGNAHLRGRYEIVEQAVLQGAQCCICVSEAMAEHYAEKYPLLRPNWLTIPVSATFAANFEIAPRVPTDNRRPVALYSGGVQAWQNLDAMLELVESTGNDIDFRFLSHEHVQIQRRIEESKLTYAPAVGYCNKIDLPAAYRAADFGMVLRDASPVNRVSCPTKLVEYLLFGLIPVIRSPHLGDFSKFRFAYISEEEFKAGFIPDAATRDWMAEQNLDVVLHLTKQFYAGTQELRTMISGKLPVKLDHDDPVALRGGISWDNLGKNSPNYYLDLAKIDCQGYLKRKPEWVTRDQGAQSLNYVMGLVKHFEPHSVLEIGVAAGLTSGAMLVASHTYDNKAKVYGIDTADVVYYKPTKKIASLVNEAYPELRSRLELFLGKTSTDIPELLEDRIDFVYIDGLHSHPWPTIDVLNSLTRLDEGGIIAMDGVHFGAPGHDGSTYFYHHYRGDKQTCDGVQTGAIFIQDRQTLLHHCCDVLELGWQVDVGMNVLKKTVANVETHFGVPISERIRAIFEVQYRHLRRFEQIYNVAATIQWRYVEEMQHLALAQRDKSSTSAESNSQPDSSIREHQFRDLTHFRRSVLDRHAEFPCSILEIGAYCSPTVDGSEAGVKFLDCFTTEELKPMARAAGGDEASVVHVDYVCRTDDYTESVKETFDILIACHVFEHVDHSIRWLQMVRSLLKNNGLLFLVLPDKKKSFDKFRSDTPLSHLLFEYLSSERDVSSIHSFETALYYDKTYIGEENDPADRLDMETLMTAIAPSHAGVHRHVFQAETFADKIMKPLLYTGVVDYELLELANCTQFGEFAVVLKAGRGDATRDPGTIFSPAIDTVGRAETHRIVGSR